MTDPLITQAAIEAATDAFTGVSAEEYNATWGIPAALSAALPHIIAALAAQAGENESAREFFDRIGA